MERKTLYCVYLLECGDGSYYCGIAADMDKRLKQHTAGTASKYTRGRRPVTVLVRTGYWYTRAMAQKLEKAMKKLPKQEKPNQVARLTPPSKQVLKQQ